jgi:guanylate kinase
VKRGRLLVISGPSGAGKSEIARRLAAAGIERVVTMTTRAPREGESEGEHYRFVGREEFESRAARGEFLEHAQVDGELYGTPRAEVEKGLSGGRTALLVLDPQGAAEVKRLGVLAVFVFVAPPDMGELRRRLKARGTESPEAIERRLGRAQREMKRRGEYDRVVVNDDVERAAEEILRLVGGEV